MNPMLSAIDSHESAQGGFTPAPVSEAQLSAILAAAVRAPSASNRQSYSILVVREAAVIRERFGFEAPCALLFCVDYNRVLDTARYLGETYEVNGVVSFVHGAIDTCLAAQNAALAAESLGLGTLVTNSLHRRPLEDVYRQFSLPEQYCFPLLVLLCGTAAKKRPFRKGRLTGPGVVHYECYHRLSQPELADLVAYADAPENHMLPPMNVPDGESFLRWYFRNWPNKPSAAKQAEFMDRLRRSGFAL